MKKLIFISVLLSYTLFGQNIDSLKIALKNAKHDTTKVRLRYEIGSSTSLLRLGYWDSLSQDAKRLNQHKILASTLYKIGRVYGEKGDFSKALEYYERGFKVSRDNADKLNIAEYYASMGIFYDNQGDVTKSLEYTHKALKIKEEIGDKREIARTLNSIGGIYYDQGAFDIAFDYWERCLKINRGIGSKIGIATSLNNIGALLLEKKELNEAMKYYVESVKILEEVGNKRGLSFALSNIGIIYESQGNFTEALNYYEKSLKLSELADSKMGSANTLNYIANLLLSQNKIQDAYFYGNKCMLISKELGYPLNLISASKTLKNILRKQNKHKEAFEMYELEIKMRDSINNQETQKAGVKKQMQYQYETQARELKNEQDKKDIIAKAELKQREKERNYFVIGFSLVILLALFIFRSYRQKQKANLIITQQKYQVEESRKEILDSIYYAQRIQKAHLPTDKYIETTLARLKKKA